MLTTWSGVLLLDGKSPEGGDVLRHCAAALVAAAQ
jgi:hypothetical protein